MNTPSGTPACNFCDSSQSNPSAAGWVRLPGTPVDFCPNCAAQPVTAILKNWRNLQPSPPAGPAGMQRYQLPNGAQVSVPAGAPPPPGGTLIPPGIQSPPAPPLRTGIAAKT